MVIEILGSIGSIEYPAALFTAKFFYLRVTAKILNETICHDLSLREELNTYRDMFFDLCF